MDSFSDSSRCELDSTTSGESLNELPPHCSSPNLPNGEELIKQAASLELANERLRIDLENLRIELNTKIAANQGLKDKITVLYVDAQSTLQEKRKIERNLKSLESQLTISENSTKWYQKQLHQVQASKKTLQIEVETYQEMLKQKQQLVSDIIFKSSQLNKEYVNLFSKYKEEKDQLQNEINQRLMVKRDNFTEIHSEDCLPDLSTNLETTEQELRETKVQLCLLEQKFLNSEIEKSSMENAYAKQLSKISSLEDNLQRLEVEKNELEFNLRQSRVEVEKYKTNSDTAELALNSSKQNQIQVEMAISELQIQLSKMLMQYKLVRTRNLDLEEKVNSMQEALDESKRLKLLSFNANSSLLQKLKKEKQKVKKLESFSRKRQNTQRIDEANKADDNSVENCLQQDLNKNKELKEQLKSVTRVSEESIDEGYADGISLGPATNLPSSPAINPVLLLKINDILYKSKHLMNPIQTEVHQLQMKIEKFKEEQNKFLLSSTNFHDRSISTVSSPNNTRTLL